MLMIRVYEDVAAFEQEGAQWRELLSSSAANQIFLTAEWLATWWKAFQPGELLVLIVEDPVTQQWMGAAPWFIAHEDGRRVVRFVGCEDVTDYLDVIARRGAEEAVVRALVQWLGAHPDRYDEARLCNIPQGAASLTLFPALAPDQGLAAEVRVLDVCPQIVLLDQFETYISSLDKKNRHELRRKLRRASGLVEWHIVGPEHDLREALQRFMALMAVSSSEKAEFLRNPANRQFFEAMVPVVAAQGWLQLAFLTVGGEAAAAYLNFVYGNRVLVYNSGHNPEAHGALSPGIVLMARLIEHAIAEGREVFDFLRGNEPYKYDLGGRDVPVYELRLVPA